MKKSSLILLMTTVVGYAQAHPGHGHGNPLSPGHYVSSPEHALPLTLAITAGVILVLWLTSRFQGRPIKK